LHKKRLENGEEIPKSDLPYLKGLANKNLLTPLHFHLIEINRFLFSASMLSRSPMEATVNLLEGVFYLPILGLYFTSDSDTTQAIASFNSEGDTFMFKIGYQLFDMIDKLLFLAERGSTEFIQEDNAFLQASILGSGGKMILDRIDPFIHLEWSSLYRNPDGSGYLPLGFSEINKEVPVVKNAFQLIEKYWSVMANHISSTIRAVHLVKSPYQDRHMSCTSELFFGSILTSTGNEFQLAEALVHEFSHNLLNMVILGGEIFEGQVPQEEIYYSPWREDPRHISGVLHAVFVFTNVSELLDRLSEAYPDNFYLNARKFENFVRLEMGLMVLREFTFQKEFAKAILLDLDNKIQRLKVNYSHFDLRPSKKSQVIHLRRWIENHGKGNLPISLLDYLEGET
jgi:HEXXH motif-containing protein